MRTGLSQMKILPGNDIPIQIRELPRLAKFIQGIWDSDQTKFIAVLNMIYRPFWSNDFMASCRNVTQISNKGYNRCQIKRKPHSLHK